MKISVLIATFGRPEYLARCVDSLLAQARRPDELVFVTRRDDVDTDTWISALASGPPDGVAVRHARVAEPGVLAANRAGLPLVSGEILCFIDDDAAARPDWLERIESGFSHEPHLGAMGGRDLQHTAAGVVDEPTDVVGHIRWYGRILGNHHRRWPGVHRVDSLKGCNMAYRRDLVRGFDEGIIGHAHYYEMDLCFGVRRAGYEVVYDGDMVVDHYVNAPRFLPGSTEAGSKKALDPDWFYFMHHNRVYVMLKNLSALRRAVFLMYTFTSDALRAVLGKLRGSEAGNPQVLRAVFRGKLAGLERYRRRAGQDTVTGSAGRNGG